MVSVVPRTTGVVGQCWRSEMVLQQTNWPWGIVAGAVWSTHNAPRRMHRPRGIPNGAPIQRQCDIWGTMDKQIVRIAADWDSVNCLKESNRILNALP